MNEEVFRQLATRSKVVWLSQPVQGSFIGAHYNEYNSIKALENGPNNVLRLNLTAPFEIIH